MSQVTKHFLLSRLKILIRRENVGLRSEDPEGHGAAHQPCLSLLSKEAASPSE